MPAARWHVRAHGNAHVLHFVEELLDIGIVTENDRAREHERLYQSCKNADPLRVRRLGVVVLHRLHRLRRRRAVLRARDVLLLHHGVLQVPEDLPGRGVRAALHQDEVAQPRALLLAAPDPVRVRHVLRVLPALQHLADLHEVVEEGRRGGHGGEGLGRRHADVRPGARGRGPALGVVRGRRCVGQGRLGRLGHARRLARPPTSARALGGVGLLVHAEGRRGQARPGRELPLRALRRHGPLGVRHPVQELLGVVDDEGTDGVEAQGAHRRQQPEHLPRGADEDVGEARCLHLRRALVQRCVVAVVVRHEGLEADGVHQREDVQVLVEVPLRRPREEYGLRLVQGEVDRREQAQDHRRCLPAPLRPLDDHATFALTGDARLPPELLAQMLEDRGDRVLLQLVGCLVAIHRQAL
mmetsp:Transcript_111316/g.315120  ORF Transcript_111316/g.315120 Transcript_111316/m.315120 type:complete len:412 (-) Transcript_111316:605-1840(-)